ncbi:MAG TPA: long-chain fatty acid--CoA ligase [Acidimicrobiia bacterium]|nr:long-chain fatty acid--CoA ligase [Acidimicrobiia bacterium]
MSIANQEVARAVEGRTIPLNFLETVSARPDSVAVRWHRDASTDVLTYRDYAAQATRLAAALGELGVGPGSRVVLLVRNRPEFHVADVATMLTGATPISIYNSSSPEQIRYLARHCGASVAIVEDAGFLEGVLKVRDDLPDLAHVVVIDDPPGGVPSGVLRWAALLEADPVDLESAAHLVAPSDLATVIYTSGTTGDPKGVMLDHANVCWTEESLRLALGFSTEGYRVVSYLPMAHIAERMVSHYSGITLGYEITACPDLHLVLGAFQEARPQLLFGVPRTYERIHSGVRAVLAGDPDKEAAFDRALAVGRDVAATRALGDEPSGALASRWEQVDAETLRPVRELLGLADVQCAVTSAAPMPVEILDFFRSLGVPLSEMYGLSESSGPVTWEPHRVRTGTVGRAIPGLELRLDDDGEVLVRGGNVFRGYLDDPVRTTEALDPDGWLHSGDVGEIDGDGYLRIVDRKKELIITASGKNISPANLEAALKAQPLIGQACAIGDGEAHIVALVVLDAEVAPVWASRHGIEPGSVPGRQGSALADDPRVVDEIAHEVHEANERFSHAEQIRRFLVLGDEWLPDSEELTPTMKLKRRGILAKFADQIAALYRGDVGAEPTPR